jgi:glycosyltransferase involved in cell wall biosynthesis
MANPAAASSLQSPRIKPPALTAAASTAGQPHRVVYLSGEPGTPGHSYRVERPLAALAALGAAVTWMTEDDVAGRLAEIRRATVLVIWRATWSDRIADAVAAARAGGAVVAFDIDDLMVDPELARLSVIDGIRTQDLTEEMVRDHYTGIRQTLDAADLCLTTTEELATHTRRAGHPSFVLANGFDHDTLARSRLAVRRHRLSAPDGLIRIGYAAGSRTHQRDFALCADAVAEIMRKRPAVRLVGFQPNDGSPPILDVEEFPALRDLAHRIEWRSFVPLEDLPDEVARFDINLAPLEIGNPFCEAKSELKFFEAALVDVPTVASATGPFRRAIRDGETGFLAASPEEWAEALLRLVDDAALRREMALKAQLSVLWRFGPEQRREQMAALLDILGGDRRGAHAFAAA